MLANRRGHRHADRVGLVRRVGARGDRHIGDDLLTCIGKHSVVVPVDPSIEISCGPAAVTDVHGDRARSRLRHGAKGDTILVIGAALIIAIAGRIGEPGSIHITSIRAHLDRSHRR